MERLNISNYHFKHMFLTLGWVLIFMNSWCQTNLPMTPEHLNKDLGIKELGDHTSSMLIAADFILKFRQSFDQLQRKKDTLDYKILNIEDRSIQLIPLKIMNALNKFEFKEYILRFYSESLSFKDVIDINRFFRSRQGKIIKKLIQNRLLALPILDNKTPGKIKYEIAPPAYIKYQEVNDQLFNKLYSMFVLYINEKMIKSS